MTLAMPVSAAIAPTTGDAWRRHGAALLLVALLLIALFAGDAAVIATTWWTSTTFEHCLLVGPVIGWLVWRRRHELSALTPAAWAPGLTAVAVGGAAWLVGEAGAVAVARQFGLLVMLQGSVVTLLGPVVTRGLLFPLGYAFFLVPFGEWLEAPLQQVTVRLVMPLMALIGLPASSDGVVIHAGRYWFEVAEACSGAKFVIAMIAVGVLVAQLCYRRWFRRIAFLAACVVVPVLANGVRAAMTMWVANLSSVEAAAGFDHIVYGWLWFALVMAATLAIGWRWFDRAPDAPAFDPVGLVRPVHARVTLGAAAALTVTVAAGFAGWGAAATQRPVTAHGALELPDVSGWTRVALDSGSTAWRPYYPAADQRLIARYIDAAGEPVDLAVALFDRQAGDRNVAAYGTGAVGEGPWLRIADLPPIAGASAMRIAAPGPVERVVTTRYVVGDHATASPALVKLATLRAHLLGGSQRAVAVHLSATAGQGRDPAAAIARFATAMPAEPLVERRR